MSTLELQYTYFSGTEEKQSILDLLSSRIDYKYKKW